MNAHDFEFTAIDGSRLPLSRFAGKPVLVVNTASECGFTPQYAELQRLWQDYRSRGLMVVGVPSNDFGDQEPGGEGEIDDFCRTNYGVDFPLTSKEHVIGGAAHPFYRWVTGDLGEVAAPRWNFHKYLIAPDGSLAGLWPSAVGPRDRQILDTVDELLDG